MTTVMAEKTTKYGQVVVGPPVSGKTTYCKALASLLTELGREVAIINLDPANDELPYTAAVDIKELASVEEVMEQNSLGPNGALVFCMNVLKYNIKWLFDKINNLGNCYFIFDFPGQSELYTHHDMVKDIFAEFERNNLRFCSVFLVDSHYANDPSKYISALMLTLSSMLQLGCPTVNILSKVDVMERYGKLDFGLDYFTEVLDLDYLLANEVDSKLARKFSSLTKAIAEVVTDYALVSFIPLAVESRQLLLGVLKACDKANGYVYGSYEERNIQRLLSCAVGADFDHTKIGSARDMYTNDDSSDSEEELLKMLASQNKNKCS